MHKMVLEQKGISKYQKMQMQKGCYLDMGVDSWSSLTLRLMLFLLFFHFHFHYHYYYSPFLIPVLSISSFVSVSFLYINFRQFSGVFSGNFRFRILIYIRI